MVQLEGIYATFYQYGRDLIWIISAISSILPFPFLVWFAYRGKKRLNIFRFLLLFVPILIVSVIDAMLIKYSYFPMARIFYSILALPVLYWNIAMVSTANLSQNLFALFVFKSYFDVTALFMQAFLFYFNGTIGGLAPDTSAALTRIFTHVLFLPFMCLFIKRWMRPVMNLPEISGCWEYLWIVPFCFYVIYRLGVSPSYTSPSYDWGEAQFYLPYAWAGGTFVCYGVMLRMLSRISQNVQLQEKLRISKMQIALQHEQYEHLRDNIVYIQRAKHDLRHTLFALNGYAEQGDIPGLQNYLTKYLHIFDQEEQELFTENSSINALLSHYIQLARKHGVDVQADVNMPHEFGGCEVNICIILGNLLENAYEACTRQTKGEKYIHIRANLSGNDILTILVENTYDGAIRCVNDTFLSSKRQEEGIGISSVRAIAEHYHGVTNFTYENGVFRASILLSLPILQPSGVL